MHHLIGYIYAIHFFTKIDYCFIGYTYARFLRKAIISIGWFFAWAISKYLTNFIAHLYKKHNFRTQSDRFIKYYKSEIRSFWNAQQLINPRSNACTISIQSDNSNLISKHLTYIYKKNRFKKLISPKKYTNKKNFHIEKFEQ